MDPDLGSSSPSGGGVNLTLDQDFLGLFQSGLWDEASARVRTLVRPSSGFCSLW